MSRMAGYIELTDAERLYVLRCLSQVGHGTANKVGIAYRALCSLRTDGLVEGETGIFADDTIFQLSPKGKAWLAEHGGGFTYG